MSPGATVPAGPRAPVRPLRQVPGPLRVALDDERTARAAWSRLAEPGDAQASRLVAECGAVAALEAVLAGHGAQRWRLRLEGADPGADLRLLRRLGGRLLVPDDPEWPRGLADLDTATATDGRPLGQPLCLWVRGPLELAAAATTGAALVGSRAATAYGEHVAAELSAGLGERGFAVWSGGAYGIDAAAHRASAATGGPTVAVLAGGVDRLYPRGNTALLERIAETGALVSEVPPGSAPTRWRFLERNRLIAAATRGTVVVEAAWRSGALATADRAERLLRPVGAVPGPVTSAASAGCHRLLRERGAVCVTDAAEAAELLGPVGEHLPPPRTGRQDDLDGLSPADRRVAEVLPSRAAASTEALAASAGLDVACVQAALGRLHLAGIAAPVDGAWRRSAPQRRP
ncbi:DNA processing protein [Kineococcus xinjiangensis]|uniref:DNA processing protein n=1 Tax=Kineococcus xinjiangensis TaxID=512762 RepID=A0A2S6IVY3_9ACTN|nr:DNA-processing protein DprA [Kineococcus xinjiangensis]PPK98519.1 DNA processing protein [Kineococcus xinjiangensis]